VPDPLLAVASLDRPDPARREDRAAAFGAREAAPERLTLSRLVETARRPLDVRPEAKARYEAQHDVVDCYYGGWIEVAVALIRDPHGVARDRIEVACAPDVNLDQDAEELLLRTCALYHQVDLTFEAGRDRALGVQMLYGVVAGLFKDLDRTAATRDDRCDAAIDCREIAYLEEAYACAEGYVHRAAQRRAQMRYLAGMVAGFVIVAVVGIGLSIGLGRLPNMRAESAIFLASLIAGAAGALLSVLFGMTSGKLRLHTLFASSESGRGPLVAAGALRPLLGALSGTVVHVFLASRLLPLEVPDGAARTYFSIAIAIVAGFSERWARGVLAGTEHRMGLADDGRGEPSARPERPAAPGAG
jgi:hypothetical protein